MPIGHPGIGIRIGQWRRLKARRNARGPVGGDRKLRTPWRELPVLRARGTDGHEYDEHGHANQRHQDQIADPSCDCRRHFAHGFRFLVALPRPGLVTLRQTFVRRSHGGIGGPHYAQLRELL